jgi:hypothetical protein
VVIKEDEERSIKPLAFVVLKAGKSPSPQLAEELKQHVKSCLAMYNYPRWVEFMNEPPKTVTGKSNASSCTRSCRRFQPAGRRLPPMSMHITRLRYRPTATIPERSPPTRRADPAGSMIRRLDRRDRLRSIA